MRLLLTSSGIRSPKITARVVEEIADMSGARACLVTAMRRESDQVYVDEAVRELTDLGVHVHVVNIAKEIETTNLATYDIYYICGGNTFYILDRMRKTGMDAVLIQAILDNKLYIGVSAGSIIVGPDIEIAGWGEYGDENDIGLDDLSGFGVTPYLVYPHYTPEHESGVRAFEEKRVGEFVVRLMDGQALHITDRGGMIV